VILEHFLDSGEPVTILTQQTDWSTGNQNNRKMPLFSHICKSLLQNILATIHAHCRFQSYFSPG
jgi:hypothetical protein